MPYNIADGVLSPDRETEGDFNQVLALDFEQEEIEEEIRLRKIPKSLLDKIKAGGLCRPELKQLVTAFHNMQSLRVAICNGAGRLKSRDERASILCWFAEEIKDKESELKAVMKKAAMSTVVGRWALSAGGCGEVTAATCLAILRHPVTPGAQLRFAGADPTRKWWGSEEAEELFSSVKKIHPGHTTAELLMGIASGMNMKLERFVGMINAGRDKPLAIHEMAKSDILGGIKRCPWNQLLKKTGYLFGKVLVKNTRRPNLAEDYPYVLIMLKEKAREREKNLSGANIPAANLGKTRCGSGTTAWKWYAGCYSPEGALKYWEATDARNNALSVFKEALALEIAELGISGKDQIQQWKAPRLEDWGIKNPAPPLPILLKPGEGQPMLPPAQVQQRAEKKAWIMFLNHWWAVDHRVLTGAWPTDKPYVLSEHMPPEKRHVHFIDVPNKGLVEGLLTKKTKLAKTARTGQASLEKE